MVGVNRSGGGAGGGPLLRIISSGSMAQPVAGDILNVVLGNNIEASGYNAVIDRGAGFVALTSSFPYTLQAADIPPLGSARWPIVARAIDLTLVSNPLYTINPVVPGFPRRTLGLATPFLELSSGALTSNSSWRTVTTRPRAFTRIRCVLYNRDTANPLVGAKADWSPSESLANNARPTIGGVVNDGSHTIFTFGGSTTVTLPVASAANVPSQTVSDWMETPSIAPTDGSTYPYIYATMFFTTGAQIGYSRPGLGTQSQRVFLEGLSGMKHKFRAYTQTIDAIANPAGFNAASIDAGNCVPMGIEVEYATPTSSILDFGDSTHQGTGNTGNAGAALMALAPMDAAGALADVYAAANQGQTAAVMYTRAMNAMAVHKPHIVIFQPFSVNDTLNYAGSAAAAKTRVDNMIAYCAANSINLILDTPQPIIASGGAAVSGAELTALADMTSYILSKASNVVKVTDLSDLHSAPNSGVWAVAYGSDNYHPNPAGYVLKTSKTYTAIDQIG